MIGGRFIPHAPITDPNRVIPTLVWTRPPGSRALPTDSLSATAAVMNAVVFRLRIKQLFADETPLDVFVGNPIMGSNRVLQRGNRRLENRRGESAQFAGYQFAVFPRLDLTGGFFAPFGVLFGLLLPFLGLPRVFVTFKASQTTPLRVGAPTAFGNRPPKVRTSVAKTLAAGPTVMYFSRIVELLFARAADRDLGVGLPVARRDLIGEPTGDGLRRRGGIIRHGFRQRSHAVE